MRIIHIPILTILLAVSMQAQTITGSIKGTVLDGSGAVVPKVKLTATKAGTNVSTSAVSN